MRHTRVSHDGVQERCPSDVENSSSANGLQAQGTPAINAHSTALKSARPSQAQNSIEQAESTPGFADIATSTSDIRYESSDIHAPLSAQSVSDNTRLGDEAHILRDVINQVHDQTDLTVPPQHFGDLAPGAFNDVDFLWDWDLSAHDFLPATFFDSEQRLSDLWRSEVPQDSFLLSTALEGVSVIQDVGVQHSAIALPLYERLPPLEPDYELSNNERLPIQDLRHGTVADTQPSLAPILPWNISIQAYKSTCDAFLPCVSLVDDTFAFPSRRTLSRFLEAYFQDFHQYLPFLHVPTTIVSALAPELVLAMAAAGGCYRFEDKRWHSLYAASKAIILHKINASVASTGRSFAPDVTESDTNGSQPLQTMQALTINTALASWSGKPMAQE